MSPAVFYSGNLSKEVGPGEILTATSTDGEKIKIIGLPDDGFILKNMKTLYQETYTRKNNHTSLQLANGAFVIATQEQSKPPYSAPQMEYPSIQKRIVYQAHLNHDPIEIHLNDDTGTIVFLKRNKSEQISISTRCIFASDEGGIPLNGASINN